MTPAEYAAMIANQPGASAGLAWSGPLPPPVTERAVGPREGVSGPPGDTPGLDDSHIVAEFRKPSGQLVYLQADNASVYLAKGYIMTGVTFSWDDWNLYAASIDRWRAIGSDQTAGSPPLFPGPFAGNG